MFRSSPGVVTGLLILVAVSCKAQNSKDFLGAPRGWGRRLALRRNPAERLVAAGSHGSCPRGCNVHGVCNEELGRCDCPRHFTGPSCNHVAPNVTKICSNYSLKKHECWKDVPCFNSCNQRGKCIAGMCHCELGYWGMDCSISWGPDGKPQLLEGHYKPRKTGVKVYVYDLPSNLTSWFGIARLDRPVHLMLWQRLMSSGMRTLDGNEADYYFIPVNTRGVMAREHLLYALSYIRRTWPWWSTKDHGHRHLIIHTGDMGVNDYPPNLRNEMNDTFYNVTWLTHWGLYENHPVAKWEAAHRPGKDIVIPTMILPQGLHESPMNPAVEAEARATGSRLERNGTLFFAGRICGDRADPDELTGLCGPGHVDYSFGVRQAVYQLHRKARGFKVLPWTPTYLHDISTHTFCLAPVGGGYGKRQILAAFMGCVPVLIGDHVLQPFEPEIDWTQFSVSVAEKDIPLLPRILGAVTQTELAAKQKRLRCAAQHMFYSSSLGAILGEDGRYDAFETLMEILRVRKEHPDVPPEKYTKVDERFRKFVDCDLDGPDPLPLCTEGSERQFPDRPACGECMHKDRTGSGGRFFGTAGGFLCCADADMSQCPRAWT